MDKLWGLIFLIGVVTFIFADGEVKVSGKIDTVTDNKVTESHLPTEDLTETDAYQMGYTEGLLAVTGQLNELKEKYDKMITEQISYCEPIGDNIVECINKMTFHGKVYSVLTSCDWDRYNNTISCDANGDQQ